MTDILAPIAPSLFEDSISSGPYYSVPNRAEESWKEHYLGGSMPLLTSHWGSTTTDVQLPAISAAMDLHLLQQTSDAYAPSFPSTAAQMISPSLSYSGAETWASPNLDMGTPSTTAYSNIQPHGSIAHSPHSSHTGDYSPHSHHNSIDQHTFVAPETRTRRATTGTAEGPRGTKRRAVEEDDGFSPNDDGKTAGTGNRGRRRQRIPHTAVERRYRENLNAHLDKLRQTVPAFNARQSGSSGKAVELGETNNMRPSKCEVLNGAIEHIGNMDKENEALRNQVKMLRARIDELERWYQS